MRIAELSPSLAVVAAATAGFMLAAPMTASATAPCGDFEECRVLVEINSTDGDIGFHWLADGEALVATSLTDPQGHRIFGNSAQAELRTQGLTETFGESAEPVCRRWLAESPDDPVVTLPQFLRRWPVGPYAVQGVGTDGATLRGRTLLTHWLPAAPRHLTFSRGVVTWEPGVALGACASESELWQMVGSGLLPIHPMNVPVAAWEVTLELGDGSGRSFTVRLPARGPSAQMSVTVPAEFLYSVQPDTPAKLEVGAIGGRLAAGDDDNATFTELQDLCLNRQKGCPAGE